MKLILTLLSATLAATGLAGQDESKSWNFDADQAGAISKGFSNGCHVRSVTYRYILSVISICQREKYVERQIRKHGVYEASAYQGGACCRML